MVMITQNSRELSYADSVATLRMIKTLELEVGQKRLIQKLHKNILDSFSSDIKDHIKTIERVRDIFKVPDGDLHKSIIKLVTQKFEHMDSMFHLQFIIYLIKEVKMVESPKLNKHEKELEEEILSYMDVFI